MADDAELESTSAIPGMTVAEVRRALGRIRSIWSNADPQHPLFLSDPLVNSLTIGEFATLFVGGHHLKRHEKSKCQRAALVNAYEIEKFAASGTIKLGVPAPKGKTLDDPFPFTRRWRPRTEEGRRAFEARGWKFE